MNWSGVCIVQDGQQRHMGLIPCHGLIKSLASAAITGTPSGNGNVRPNLFELEGRGWIVGFSVYNQLNASSTVGGSFVAILEVDGREAIRITASTSNNKSSTAITNLKINQELLGLPFELYGGKNLSGNTNATTDFWLDAPISFSESVVASMIVNCDGGLDGTGHWINGCCSMDYILDCGEGGVTRKLTQITRVRAIDFEGRCAA